MESKADLIRKLGENGRILTVTFIKRTTGELRVMNCRLGVKKGVKGIGMSYNPAEKNLLGVYDMQNGGFRMIALESILKISGGGETHTFSQN